MQPDSNPVTLAADLSARTKAAVLAMEDDVMASLGAAALTSILIDLGLFTSEDQVTALVPKIMPFVQTWAAEFREYVNAPEYGAAVSRGA
jgi:hypothetical protein